MMSADSSCWDIGAATGCGLRRKLSGRHDGAIPIPLRRWGNRGMHRSCAVGALTVVLVLVDVLLVVDPIPGDEVLVGGTATTGAANRAAVAADEADAAAARAASAQAWARNTWSAQTRTSRSWSSATSWPCRNASSTDAESSSNQPTGRCSPPCYTGCLDRRCDACGCWSTPTPSCAGTATSSPTITRSDQC